MGGKKAKDQRKKVRDVAATRVIAHKIADHAHHLHDRLHPNEPPHADHPPHPINAPAPLPAAAAPATASAPAAAAAAAAEASAPSQPASEPGFVFGGKIYVVGGVSNPPTLECFDPVLRKWTVIAQMPIARGGMDAVFFDGRYLMMAGGRRDKAESGAVEIFDVTVQSAAAPRESESGGSGGGAAGTPSKLRGLSISKKKALPAWKAVPGVPNLKKARQWATTVVVDE